MSNVLNEEKKKQVIALGQLGWALRRIEKETGVRRETAAGYLKAAGISVRQAGGWGRRRPPPSKPANEVTTGPDAAKPANDATPDFGAEVAVSTGAAAPTPQPGRNSGYCYQSTSGAGRPLILDSSSNSACNSARRKPTARRSSLPSAKAKA